MAVQHPEYQGCSIKQGGESRARAGLVAGMLPVGRLALVAVVLLLVASNGLAQNVSVGADQTAKAVWVGSADYNVRNSKDYGSIGGVVLVQDAIILLPGSHTAFVLSDRLAGVRGRRGTLELRRSDGYRLSVLGLRFNPFGSFTSVPSAH